MATPRRRGRPKGALMSAFLTIAMVASLLCPGGSAALAEGLDGLGMESEPMGKDAESMESQGEVDEEPADDEDKGGNTKPTEGNATTEKQPGADEGSMSEEDEVVPEDAEPAADEDDDQELFVQDGPDDTVNIPYEGKEVLDLSDKGLGYMVAVYDAGGPDGNYEDSNSGTLMVLPPAGYALRLSGIVDTEDSWDYFYVIADYESAISEYGFITDRSRLMAEVTGSSQPVDLTVVDDPMLLYLDTDGSNNYSGLDLIVEVVEIPEEYAAKDKHAVICAEVAGGSATADKQRTYADKIVKVTVQPDAGKVFKGLAVTYGDGQEVALREAVSKDTLEYTFVSPEGDVTVTPEFADALTVTFVDTDGTELGKEVVAQGNNAKAPSVAPREGQMLKGWRDGEELFDLTSPIEEDTTLTAVWVEGISFVEDFDSTKEYRLPDGWVGSPFVPVVSYDATGQSKVAVIYSRAPVALNAARANTAVFVDNPELIPQDLETVGDAGEHDTSTMLCSPVIDMSAAPTTPTLSFSHLFVYQDNPDFLEQLAEDGATLEATGVFEAYYRTSEDGPWTPLWNTNTTLPHVSYDTLSDALVRDIQNVTVALPQDAVSSTLQIGFKVYADYTVDVSSSTIPEDGRDYYVYNAKSSAIYSCYYGAVLDDVSVQAGGHAWSYAVSDAGDELVATCGNGADVCAVDGAVARARLEVADATYSGEPVEAKVVRDEAFIPANGIAALGEVTYWKGGERLAGAPADAGSYTARVTATAGEDSYELRRDFAIAPVAVGVTWSGTKLTYSGKAQAPKATATGLLPGDSCDVTVEGAAKDAGTHTAKATGLSNANYVLKEAATTRFTIAPKVVGLKWSGTKLTYSGKSQGPKATATGLVAGDSCAVTVTGAEKGAGTHTAKATKISNANYALPKSASTKFTIAPKVVGLRWSGTKLTYSGKSQAPKATATGLVAGDSCAVTVTGAAKDAGTHTATAAKLSNRNYALPKANTSKFTIAKARLTVTAKAKTIAFGSAPANAGVTYSGFVGSDSAKSLAGRLAYSYGGYKKGSKAGTYEITPRGLSSGNYAIAYKAGRLTVTAPAKVATTAWARVTGRGWVESGSNGVFGTVGESLPLTGLRIGLASLPYAGSVQYRAHAKTSGWQKAWTTGAAACVSADGKQLEAVQVRLTGQMAKGYDVWYRVHVRGLGWMAWARNGASAGTTGGSRRAEAVQVAVLRKGSAAPSANYKGIKQAYAKAFRAE